MPVGIGFPFDIEKKIMEPKFYLTPILQLVARSQFF